jgi:hypothetical protein
MQTVYFIGSFFVSHFVLQLSTPQIIRLALVLQTRTSLSTEEEMQELQREDGKGNPLIMYEKKPQPRGMGFYCRLVTGCLPINSH